MRTFHGILDVNKDGVISFDDFKLLADRFVNLGHLSEKHKNDFKTVIQVSHPHFFCSLKFVIQLFTGLVGKAMGRNNTIQLGYRRKVSRKHASRFKRQIAKKKSAFFFTLFIQGDA